MTVPKDVSRIRMLTCIFLLAKEVDRFSSVYISFGRFLQRSIYGLFILKTCWNFAVAVEVEMLWNFPTVVLILMPIITLLRFKTLNGYSFQSPCLTLYS